MATRGQFSRDGDILETALSKIASSLSSVRRDHATDTLMDAAESAGAGTDEEFLEFVAEATSDERRQELLARTLTIAQDTALRSNRRALGRALANGVADNGVLVDQELLFIRVVDALDAPDVRLLALMGTTPPQLAGRYPDTKR